MEYYYWELEKGHIYYIEAIVKSIHLAKFKLNSLEYIFVKIEVLFVRYRVMQHRVDTESKKIEAIISWLTLTIARQ
jgi:hypothetical protein